MGYICVIRYIYIDISINNNIDINIYIYMYIHTYLSSLFVGSSNPPHHQAESNYRCQNVKLRELLESMGVELHLVSVEDAPMGAP